MKVKELHIEAMKYSQRAFVKLQEGNEVEAIKLYSSAYQLERQAAMILLDKEDKEPTRSVLFKSAAYLAMKSKNYREAEKMACYGLAGSPPISIAKELRGIIEDVNLFRHLELDGRNLDENEFQLSLYGNAIGYGFAPSREFLSRFEIMEKLIFRTTERIAKKDYRKGGSVTGNIKNKVESYISAPRPNSFAINIRLSQPTGQLEFFQDNIQAQVVDAIIDGLQKIENSQEKELKAQITDGDYFSNFISLVKGLAPDGDRIKQVGLTVLRNGVEKKVSFERIRKEISIDFQEDEFDKMIDSPMTKSTKTGVLLNAFGAKNQIELKEDGTNKLFKIEVPSGLEDIVKIHFNNNVKVIVKGTNDKDLKLVDIEAI